MVIQRVHLLVDDFNKLLNTRAADRASWECTCIPSENLIGECAVSVIKVGHDVVDVQPMIANLSTDGLHTGLDFLELGKLPCIDQKAVLQPRPAPWWVVLWHCDYFLVRGQTLMYLQVVKTLNGYHEYHGYHGCIYQRLVFDGKLGTDQLCCLYANIGRWMQHWYYGSTIVL